jgi:hypothetical protein
MPTANTINANSEGLVKYDGAGTFTSETVTNHGIIVGGASNALSSKVLTDGQVLIGSTGADPVAASITGGAGITVTPSAGGISIASNTAAGNVLRQTITLTAAQIKALSPTPVTFLAAPGVGMAYIPISMIARLNYGGTNVFNSGGTIYMRYNGAGITGIFDIMTGAQYSLTTNTFTSNVNGNALITLAENKALELAASSSITGNAANNNTIDVAVYYILASFT